MNKPLWFLLLAYGAHCWAGPAVDVFNVPPFTENGSGAMITKESIAHDTVIEMDPFSVAIPKGWSFVAAGVSTKMTASLTTTPSPAFETDDTYVGVNERKEPPLMTLEERKQRYDKEKKGWKTSFDEWNNTRWLIVEYVDTDPKDKDKKMNHWSAFTISKGKEYWVIAATPAYKAKDMEAPIHDIIRSVALRGVAPAGASKAVASKQPVPVFDSRFQDHWKIVGYKMEDAVLWTEKEAKDMVGKIVAFDESQMTIGASSCKASSKPIADKDEELMLLDDLENPCKSGDQPGGPIFKVTRKGCTKKISFPPYFTFGSTDDMVAFGDAISFCLKREKPGTDQKIDQSTDQKMNR